MTLADEIAGDCYGMIGRIEGRRVADVGASNGVFTRWAVEHGAAHVDSYEPDENLHGQLSAATTRMPVTVHRLAVTGKGGWTTIGPHGFGVRFEPGGTPCPAIAWADVLTDVIKVDCEGCEYDLIGVDLSGVEYVGMEFHRWTTPDDPVEGLGFQNHPQERMPGELVDWLNRTHHVTVNGSLDAGGYMFGVKR